MINTEKQIRDGNWVLITQEIDENRNVLREISCEIIKPFLTEEETNRNDNWQICEYFQSENRKLRMKLTELEAKYEELLGLVHLMVN